MDTTIRRTSTGRPYQVVSWTQQWTLREDGTWCRVATVYTNGRLELWAVPDDTQN
jgi:hypothetical protein